MSRVVLVAHGAGSSPDVAVALLGPALPPGTEVVAIDALGHVAQVVTRLALAAAAHEVVLAAGISLGAHAVATWAAGGGSADALLLVMPAWTGPPGTVAALTRASADDIAVRGSAAVLADLEQDPALAEDWVLEELRRGWAQHDDADLARALGDASWSPAPTLSALARIATPSAVVALLEDPLHPEAVARDWATALPHAALALVGRTDPARDRGALGRAGRRALDGLSGSR